MNTDNTISVSVSGTTERTYNKLQSRARGTGKSFSAVWAEEMRRVADGGEMGGALVSIIGITEAQTMNYQERIVELEQELAAVREKVGEDFEKVLFISGVQLITQEEMKLCSECKNDLSDDECRLPGENCEFEEAG